MAISSKEFEDRLRLVVREAVQKFVAEEGLPEEEQGEALFTSIETLALAAGDAVSLEVFEQQLAVSEQGSIVCPDCGREGQRAKQRERCIQTRRGLEVPLSEAECYCPGCRRAFFPSVQTSGPGRGL